MANHNKLGEAVLVNEVEYDEVDDLDVSPDSPFNDLASQLNESEDGASGSVLKLNSVDLLNEKERRGEGRYPVYHSAMVYRNAGSEAFKVFVFNLSRTGVGVAIDADALSLGELVLIEVNSPEHFRAPVLLEGRVVSRINDRDLKYGRRQIFGIELENVSRSSFRHLDAFIKSMEG